jgi:PAS domain S-box-containing protein
MIQRFLRSAQAAARFLEPSSEEERDRLASHAIALFLVATVAALKYVSGLTLHSAPFTLYAIAIAASAARGGFAPAVVATLASVLVAGIGAREPVDPDVRMLFVVEALALGGIVSFVAGRLRIIEARLDASEAANQDLQLRDRRGRLLDAALRHLEDAADETAIVVLNDSGMITEWRTSAERLYGYSTEQAIGMDASLLFSQGGSRLDLVELMREVRDRGSVHRADLHCRQNGAKVHVDFELKLVRDLHARGFTLTVHDVARRREWDDYRDAAVRAQAALQQAADDTRQQLAALESLIDPELNPLGGPAMVAELLERLRSTVDADGAALVQAGCAGARAFAARGLEPTDRLRPLRPEVQRLTPGRVTLIHNDPVRVEQTSALRWPAEVTSLMVVPVVHNGQVWSTIEVVSERMRRASDWDVALMRITADRLAAVVVQDRAIGSNVA